MSNYKYARAGYIARISPIHRAHVESIRAGLDYAAEVLVMIGSARASRRPRIPFTFEEREQMLRSCFSENENLRIQVVPLRDFTYNQERWVQEVQNLMVSTPQLYMCVKPYALIGFKKDHTSSYIDDFPQWDKIMMDDVDGLNATDIRKVYFGDDDKARSQLLLDSNVMPRPVGEYLAQFKETETYRWLKSDYDWNKQYKEDHDVAPHPYAFTTADNVVVCMGHILLIQRANFPGKGLWALPGGYVDINTERVSQAAFRELVEETKINVPPAVLKSHYISQNHEFFDDVNRSDRGRVITHAWALNLPPQKNVAIAMVNEAIADGKINPDDMLDMKAFLNTPFMEKVLKKSGTKKRDFSRSQYILPTVKGADDAADAKWIPLSEFEKMESSMFEDHWQIANHFVRKM